MKTFRRNAEQAMIMDQCLTDMYADLHIHIGSAKGRAVKITASRQLQLKSIIFHDAPRKGLNIVGVVDAGSTLVADELQLMVASGELTELKQGGFLASNGVLLIAGCEVEVKEGFHFITYLPNLESIYQWQDYLRSRVSNMTLSTQKTSAGIADIIDLSTDLEGIICPAHAFTPHKGVYGMWTAKLEGKIGPKIYQIKVLELGLSADTDMADRLEETRAFAYLSNSDAHSAINIGREFNLLRMEALNFNELRWCLENKHDRGIAANFGLHPIMGKYHRTYCPDCGIICQNEPPVLFCPQCGTDRIVLGVNDRITSIQDYPQARHPSGRPPYHYRVPLKDLPGIGPAAISKLLKAVPNEIELAELTPMDELSEIAGPLVAAAINDMRQGRLKISAGGGGKYGKVSRIV